MTGTFRDKVVSQQRAGAVFYEGATSRMLCYENLGTPRGGIEMRRSGVALALAAACLLAGGSVQFKTLARTMPATASARRSNPNHKRVVGRTN